MRRRARTPDGIGKALWKRQNKIEGALFGRLFGNFGFGGSCGAIQLAQETGVNFGDGNVDGHGFLAGLDFLLVAAMTQLALDFDVSALGEFGGRIDG